MEAVSIAQLIAGLCFVGISAALYWGIPYMKKQEQKRKNSDRARRAAATRKSRRVSPPQDTQ